MGSNGVVNGLGYRSNINPNETFDLYAFCDTNNGETTHRDEIGIFVDSALVDEVAVTVIAGCYIAPKCIGVIQKLVKAIPLSKAIDTFIQELLRLGKTLGLFYLLNGEINKNSCDSEGD